MIHDPSFSKMTDHGMKIEQQQPSSVFLEASIHSIYMIFRRWTKEWTNHNCRILKAWKNWPLLSPFRWVFTLFMDHTYQVNNRSWKLYIPLNLITYVKQQLLNLSVNNKFMITVTTFLIPSTLLRFKLLFIK